MSGTKEHMPFPGHRTCAEWILDEKRCANLKRNQLEWCPEEYRPWFRHLRGKGWTSAEAKRFIRQHIQIDQHRAKQAAR